MDLCAQIKANYLVMIGLKEYFNMLRATYTYTQLDVIEVTIGYRGWVQIFIYGADLSNFLVILNSATNCLIFLRGPAWLQGKITHRNTIRNRKQLFSNLQTSTRIALLQSSWTSVQTMTSGQFGARIVYSMLRKDPSLFDVFTTVQYDGEEAPLRQTSGLIARKSFDLLTCPQYYEVGDRIMNFMGELIQMMQDGQSEQAIIERIRLVGATHYERNVMFSSCVWREFKASTLAIVGESTFESESVRHLMHFLVPSVFCIENTSGDAKSMELVCLTHHTRNEEWDLDEPTFVAGL
ncbi:unnamed protein product [Toxocara canis]|uniref:GLOBIN domain-containing protein n=1 Tax=Toxocara canis TaxID=6265 RepID=A0A183TWM4_TOXCA|nr:unnamed protein product [Toxocara canis]